MNLPLVWRAGCVCVCIPEACLNNRGWMAELGKPFFLAEEGKTSLHNTGKKDGVTLGKQWEGCTHPVSWGPSSVGPGLGLLSRVQFFHHLIGSPGHRAKSWVWPEGRKKKPASERLLKSWSLINTVYCCESGLFVNSANKIANRC